MTWNSRAVCASRILSDINPTMSETPGSIHEGGELGYSVSHAYGAAFDNPDLIVTVIVGDASSFVDGLPDLGLGPVDVVSDGL